MKNLWSPMEKIMKYVVISKQFWNNDKLFRYFAAVSLRVCSR